MGLAIKSKATFNFSWCFLTRGVERGGLELLFFLLRFRSLICKPTLFCREAFNSIFSLDLAYLSLSYFLRFSSSSSDSNLFFIFSFLLSFRLKFSSLLFNLSDRYFRILSADVVGFSIFGRPMSVLCCLKYTADHKINNK